MAKGQLISSSELYDLVLLFAIGGGVYISYRNGNLQKVWNWFKAIDIGDITGNGNGNGNTGGGGGSGTFGSGKVENHNPWRKEWDLKKRYLNASFKAYFYIPSGPADETISIKMRGGPHTGSGDNAITRQGCCYIMCLPFNGSNKNNFQKECPHPKYAKNSVPVKFNVGSILKKWTGFRVDMVNSGNGVRITTYVDTSGTVGANKWREWYSIVDTGKYGNSSATATPFTRSPVNGNNPQVIVRIDGQTQSLVSGYQMKNASIGEISGSNLAMAQAQSLLAESLYAEKTMERKPLVVEESYLARASRLKRSLA